MAHANVKTEMKGDRARWVTRAEAKSASKKIRRARDRAEAEGRRWDELDRIYANHDETGHPLA